MSDKVEIRLVPTNPLHEFKGSRFSVKKESSVLKLADVVRRKLGRERDQPLFLYFQQWAIYPDTLLGDIVDHTDGMETIDINYSLEPSFG
jgi:hypothetical protein